MTSKWQNLWVIALAELLAMALWFSASAVVPQLTREWGLDSGQQSWLTMSVQLGFVIGALASAVWNLPDRFPAQRVFAVSAGVGATVTAGIATLPMSFEWVLVCRFLTGAMLAGVYPPGMKLVASWFKEERGLAMGVLVGALTVGSAAPHLIAGAGLPGQADDAVSWRHVLLVASGLAGCGAIIAVAGARAGPLLPAVSRFDWRYAGRMWEDRAVRLANFGYFGHMWELYAMWAWVPLCLLAGYQSAGWHVRWAHVAGFFAIAVGGLGCVIAGRFADRLGRTRVAMVCVGVSGLCALVAGFALTTPTVLTVVCLLWGFAVVAESAQYSTAVSELCDARYVGTALTMQTCIGFLLTVITIRWIPALVERAGWGAAFAMLAAGPAVGFWFMTQLRRLPEAVKMASGHR